MQIQTASLADLDAIAKVEQLCFSPSTAATRQDFAARLCVFPNHFWLLKDGKQLVGLLNGMVTNELTIRDAMYVNAALHDESGAWQTVFGLEVIPARQRQGFAANLMQRMIFDAKEQGRKGCILTCKEELIPYYSKFGYENFGISQSVHGGVVWYDMRLTFKSR